MLQLKKAILPLILSLCNSTELVYYKLSLKWCSIHNEFEATDDADDTALVLVKDSDGDEDFKE